MNAVAKIDSTDIMEQVIIKGDLSNLTPQERTEYYMKVCQSIGLNPLTKPFEYIALNGKLQLYALKACTEQLRGIHDVSVLDLTETLVNDVFIVTAKVKNGEGRTDAAKGAVPIKGLQGEALANAMMKAETKAKRRATLSLCGLGWLDESEVESIPGAKVSPQSNATPAVAGQETAPAAPVPEAPPPAPAASEPSAGPTGDIRAPENRGEPTKKDWDDARTIFQQIVGMVEKATCGADIDTAMRANKDGLKHLEWVAPSNYQRLKDVVVKRRQDLAAAPAEFSDG